MLAGKGLDSMKLFWLCVVTVCVSVAGCRLIPQTNEDYVSVTMQNQSANRITGVSIGAGESCSRFGLLGSRGAGKGAVVPISFVSNFPIQWEEGADEQKKNAQVDLSSLVGSLYITLTYQGNGMWVAKSDEPQAQATTNK